MKKIRTMEEAKRAALLRKQSREQAALAQVENTRAQVDDQVNRVRELLGESGQDVGFFGDGETGGYRFMVAGKFGNVVIEIFATDPGHARVSRSTGTRLELGETLDPELNPRGFMQAVADRSVLCFASDFEPDYTRVAE